MFPLFSLGLQHCTYWRMKSFYPTCYHEAGGCWGQSWWEGVLPLQLSQSGECKQGWEVENASGHIWMLVQVSAPSHSKEAKEGGTAFSSWKWGSDIGRCQKSRKASHSHFIPRCCSWTIFRKIFNENVKDAISSFKKNQTKHSPYKHQKWALCKMNIHN